MSSFFPPGGHIGLKTAQGHLSFTIIKPFLPFTKSVALLAQPETLSASPVVIKIYDPRFFDERISVSKKIPSRPWSLTAERTAASTRAAVKQGHLQDSFDENLLYDDEPDDPEGQARRAAQWEEYFYRLLLDCFESECDVYECLREFQGRTIPHFLLSGTFITTPDERGFEPYAIVIEYLPSAANIRDIPLSVLDPALCMTLVRTVDSFKAKGVFHGDLNRSNVLFSPRDRPSRGVIIDFACGSTKRVDEDEEIWDFTVSFENDGNRIRQLFEDKGVVLPLED